MSPPYNLSVVQQLISDELTRRGRGSKVVFAHAVGVAPQTVTKWTKGEVTPDRERLPLIEEALGMPAGMLTEAAGYAPVPDTTWVDRIQSLELTVEALAQRLAEVEAVVPSTAELQAEVGEVTEHPRRTRTEGVGDPG